MLEITGMPTPVDTSCDRADELFQQHRQEIFRNTDKLFARLMLLAKLYGGHCVAAADPGFKLVTAKAALAAGAD